MAAKRGHRIGSLRTAIKGILPILLLAVGSATAQTIDQQYELLGGRSLLEQPGALAAAASGDRFAVSDISADRIYVIDLDANILWTSGNEVHLGSPKAVCFDQANNVLYVPQNGKLILRISEQDPGTIDTIADLSESLPAPDAIDQLIPAHDGGYLTLSENSGVIRRLDAAFQIKAQLIKTGNGKGKVLVPTALWESADGRVVVADRKNLAVQCFSSDGAFLFSCGWNEVALQRGWSATAVTVDSRDVIWAADDTNSRFRLFDGSGTQLTEIAFPNPLFHPVALAATSDNRVLALGESGGLTFYNLE